MTKKRNDKLVAEHEQLNEFRHDGLHSAANSHRNPTDKPAIYYIGVDQYSDNFSGYDGYVTSDGNLTAPNDFKKAGVTKLPATLKNAIAKAVAKYGKKYYIFVFKEEYSYGAWTHKNHARPFVIDIWYPDGQYWKYGLKPVNSLNESISGKSPFSRIKEALKQKFDVVESDTEEDVDGGHITIADADFMADVDISVVSELNA